MVLAVTQLHRAPLGDGVVTITGGAIQSDPLDGQFIDVTRGLPEIPFQEGPDSRVTEPLEHEGKAIVGELDGAERLARDGFEGMVQVGGPIADVALAVVGLGEDVDDPDGDEPAVGESLMERMCREMAIKNLRQAKLDEEAQQQGDIVDAFVSELQGGIHGRAPSMARGGLVVTRWTRTVKINVVTCQHGVASKNR
jgi:hypothetical protein